MQLNSKIYRPTGHKVLSKSGFQKASYYQTPSNYHNMHSMIIKVENKNKKCQCPILPSV